ncbi:hypothetical protein HS088_TW15G01386 [Tripterygium wilfordii]|uniref:C2 domain-containing protein n=1 Tax=Tripterygium wilfordii TaxID=458696 RepID=A0A7J7CP59_TRIWF|nr:hypothetical protein HS088_TW15G01386 [Tripterygium wilfordii]
MSCKGLKAFNFFQKLLVYALVSVLMSSDKDKEEVQVQQQQHRTQRDEEGDGDPEWNQEMQFDVDEGFYWNHSDRMLIHFELRHEGIMFGDKVIGEVHGKSNGVLNFSYKLLNSIPKDQPLAYTSSGNITGYPTSPRVQYPPLEKVEPLAVPQQVPHSWPTQYHYPPPPPVAHGPYYYPPPPPQVHYWPPQRHVGPQDTWSSSSGEPHALGNEERGPEERWPTPSGHHHHWSPF